MKWCKDLVFGKQAFINVSWEGICVKFERKNDTTLLFLLSKCSLRL